MQSVLFFRLKGKKNSVSIKDWINMREVMLSEAFEKVIA